MSPEEAWLEVVRRKLYVMPPAAVGPREWYVTDDARTFHGFGEGPIQAIKAFLSGNRPGVETSPDADDMSFLE
jgi:hypothetical protein